MEILPQALAELQLYRNWILHLNKVPWRCDLRYRADKTNPDDWSDYQTAVAAQRAHPQYGLGYCLSENDPFSVVDFDTYKTPDPAIIKEHAQIYEWLGDTYSEFSPSGEGAHVWCKGNVASRRPSGMYFEVCSEGHYFTVTGKPIRNVPIVDRQSHLEAIVGQYPHIIKTRNAFEEQPRAESDSVVIDKVKTRFPQLWKCDPNEDSNRSEVDFVFLKEIARITWNVQQTFDVFMQSPRAHTPRKKNDKDRMKCENRPQWVQDTTVKAFEDIDWVAERLQRFPFTIDEKVPSFSTADKSARRTNDVILQNVLDITIRATKFLWRGWLPQGTLVTLGGHGGSFKSTIAYTFAATVASGLNWPDGTPCDKPGNVIIWSNEDSIDCTIPARCIKAGLRPGRFSAYVINGVPVAGRENREFDIAVDMPALLNAAKALGNVKLIIIDPLISVVTGDNHKANDVTRSLAPLLKLAKELDSTILGIVHFRKSRMYDRAIERLNGSAAWGNVPRMNLMVAKDKKKNEGIITRAKTNLAATGGGFKFNTTLEECFDAEGIAYTAMAVVWDSTYIDGSPEEILDSVEVTEEEQSRKKPGREAANVFLQSILKNGIKRRDEIMREAVTIKDGPSERTLDRYFEELGFTSRNITDEHGFAHAYWGRPWQFEVGQWKPVQGQSYWRQ